MLTSAVHVYSLNLAMERARLGGFWAILSADERDRAARFRAERDRERFVIRRGTLRELLALYLDEAPERIRFCVNRFGKLSLPGSRLRFNLSHSHGMALYAITEGREVGCDIERSDPRFAAEHIPERLFSAREASALRALPAVLQTEAFFRCWTRKEAYVKARGHGLSIPLDSFDVSLAPGEPATLLHGCEGWSVRAFEPVPDHPAAIVAEGADWQMHLRVIPDQLWPDIVDRDQFGHPAQTRLRTNVRQMS
jgi:4'-phosphopantetheinyl transferase